jgi:hypothetical protein
VVQIKNLMQPIVDTFDESIYYTRGRTAGPSFDDGTAEQKCVASLWYTST